MITLTVDEMTLVDRKTNEPIQVYVISRQYAGRHYIFNYAYDDKQEAEKVCAALRKGEITDRIDEATDIAFDYTKFSRVYGIAKHTSQKRNWYVLR